MKSKGAAEMRVKRRFEVLRIITDELDLFISVEPVRSESNKADVLTRVKR